MYSYATGNYQNKKLILDRNFEELEGKKVKVLIFEDSFEGKADFFSFLDKNKFEISADYAFNREEINER
jgi:hypothetical protein